MNWYRIAELVSISAGTGVAMCRETFIALAMMIAEM